MDQHYHSTFGAVQESQHIFINAGFIYAIEKINPGHDNLAKFLNILEIGFGTGLNAFLTQFEAEKRGIKVRYTALEAFPLEENFWQSLNYPNLVGSIDGAQIFAKLHRANWNETEVVSPYFTIHKIHGTLETYLPATNAFDLIYFDAFGPDAQPELWTDQIFQNLGIGLVQGGSLVTYSVKGSVVRYLRSAGFRTEKLAGPPGKRHILRAIKI